MRFQRRKRKFSLIESSSSSDQAEDPSPSTVIDLTGDSSNDNDDDTYKGRPMVGSTRKRLVLMDSSSSSSSSSDDNNGDNDGEEASSFRKRIKTEGKPSAASLQNPESDDEVEIVNAAALAPTMQPVVAVAATTAAAAQSQDDLLDDEEDGEIAIVGMKNHVHLVHMRQHCTTYPFHKNNNNIGSFVATSSTNTKYCDGCYCYVCDVKADECNSWNNDHCNATDQSTQWKHKRALAKAQRNVLPSSSSLEQLLTSALTDNGHDNTTTMTTAAPRLKTALPPTRNFLAGPGPIPPQPLHLGGIGPYPPATIPRHDLTQCRYCKWFSKFNYRAVSLLQWCLHCGRVASSRIQKGQGRPVQDWKPANGDICLGTKRIPFALHVHDPRQMAAFAKQWQDKKDEWTYDKRQMERDLFHHRISETPDVKDLVDLQSPFAPENIPTDGRLVSLDGYDSDDSDDCDGKEISAVECDALLLVDDEEEQEKEVSRSKRHALLLTKLAELSNSKAIQHVISAKWDAEKSRGSFTLSVYVRETGLNKTNTADNNLGLLLGLWFDIFPCPFTQLNRAVKPSKISKKVFKENFEKTKAAIWWKTKNEKSELNKEMISAWKSFYRGLRNQDTGDGSDASQPQITLESSTRGLGGVCPTGNNLESILKNYFSECLPDEFARESRPFQRVTNCVAGLQSQHRPVWQHGREMVSRSELFEFECLSGSRPGSFDFVSLLGSHTDAAMYAFRYRCSNIIKVNSLSALLTHTENLGHTTAPFVEGLNVELLPFQRQSLQWAIERETMPGGVQSLHWPKVPLPATATEELFFNPLLGMFSKTKPNCVRGGWICEQMGMGKTIISLALVLSNTAPQLPSSGSKTTALAKAPKPVNGQPFWKPYTTSSMSNISGDENTKRGRYLARGTLVVCNVSLVGQWIEEAKSKLENPDGKIYAYYGSSRKRDAKVLAKNAIVVTTYETLVSDANYHARKAGNDSYCPPVEQIRWWRIICDESHVLRTHNAKSEVVMNISADHKWLVSGTPISTNIRDITQQMKFLGINHTATIETAFRNSIGAAVGCTSKKKNCWDFQTDKAYFGKFTWFMRSLMIRHSQTMKYRDTETTLMSLPSKEEKILKIDFTLRDKEEYVMLEEKARSFYTSFHRTLVSKAYLKVMAGLLPLRIACAGGNIPLDPVSQPEDDLDDDNDETEDGTAVPRPKKFVRLSDYTYKSKLERLIQEMVTIRDEEPASKTLIFSQFTSTLDWLRQELPKYGFQFRSLSGDMTMSKRAKALNDFQNDPPTTVFLLSMRAGAVGINLTAANRVFLLEPCFNPALEQQAIGRVWRLGQTRPVKIYRLIMKDSVEERMQSMLAKKYGDKVDKQSEALAGSLKSDKAAVVAGEFDTLFGVDETSNVKPEVKGEVIPDTASSMGI